MADSKLEIKKEIISLYEEGSFLHNYIALVENKLSANAAEKLKNQESFINIENKEILISSRYQKWYSKASLTIKQLLPDRFEEFKRLYLIEKRDNKTITNSTYTISVYQRRAERKDHKSNPVYTNTK